nr:RNA polymerase, mitochondrial [Tanacetum cinerariifolium]
KGYYGGHADAYIPFGENLYYYDVNSLYPFVMKEYPMPRGKARRIDFIEEEHLDTMLGFVLAYVECPTDIKRHFLPYRDATGEDTFVMSYKENIGVSPLDQWKPHSNSAVQLATAITASARIHMYPYISRDDCYYTDTDSVVLSQP